MSHQIDLERRAALQAGGAAAIFGMFLAAGWAPSAGAQQGGAGFIPASAAAPGWNQTAFNARGVDVVIKALGGVSAAPTKDLSWGSTPEIAENGAVVPVTVTSNLPKTEAISILVEKNPNTLTAVFTIPPGTDPSISTRVKMGESSNVYALIKADGKYFIAQHEIKVTVGGCGG